MTVVSLTADHILAIPLTEPERLFSAPEAAKAEHRELVRHWHPDLNRAPLAAKVAAHVNALYEAAAAMIARGKWQRPNEIELVGTDGKPRRIKYRKRHTFELGEMLIGARILAFIVDRRHEDFLIDGLRMIGSIRFPTNQMRTDLEKYFPKVEKHFDTADHSVIVLSKTDDVVLLRDLIAQQGGKLDPRHACWVISSLLNLACFLEITGRTHNGLTPDTVFVSPKYHTALLLGGWWYAADVGKPIRALPPAVHKLASRGFLAAKKADHSLDLASIRAIGRACLGDEAGSGFRGRTDVPKPLADWLLLPGPKSAIKDYTIWPKVRTDSFGPRKFVPLTVSFDDVYPKTGG